MKQNRALGAAVILAAMAGPRIQGAEMLPAAAGPSAKALAELKSWTSLSREKRPALSSVSFARVPLTKEDAGAAGEVLWDDHAAMIRATRQAEMKAKVIGMNGKAMRFEMLDFSGKAPAPGGRNLFISLHGGGGAPPAVNESQWRNQLMLGRKYRPGEGIYLAPRGPTDTWNLWHESHIDGFLDRLIENLIVLENVNPNHVYLMGYSAGGDGVYQLAPRMADRWAAAAMMAGHPNDASPSGLRNVPFAIQVGANDSAYKRNEAAAQWGKKLDELRKADPEGYIHFTELHKGKGHWMDLEDRKAIPWMEKFARNSLPDRIVWVQDDVPREHFYWLSVPRDQVATGGELIARRRGQTVSLAAKNVRQVTVLLNDAMLDLDEAVTIRSGEKELFSRKVPRTIATMERTLQERGDPDLVFSAEAVLELP